MRLRLAAALLAALAGFAQAEPSALGCAELGEVLTDLTGYTLALPPAPNVEGWCIADSAVLRAEGRPRITVERLHLAGQAVDGVPESLSLVLGGMRVVPELSDRSMDPRLASMLRLQTVDAMMLKLRRSPGAEGVQLEDGVIVLSGGTELSFEASFLGGGFSAREMIPAALTSLHLDWRNDGRLLRPVMEVAGERLVEGATGSAAVDATRREMLALVANLPDSAMEGDAANELRKAVEALPQGHGRLKLEFVSKAGIGLARLALAAVSDAPTGPDALGRLFADGRLTVDWQPGLAP
ncbi:MAG: hypothetical protein J0L76_17925 [Rhodobacterales bacterium]|nr:hypothetical protein [Rhodobacterales bacterium]